MSFWDSCRRNKLPERSQSLAPHHRMVLETWKSRIRNLLLSFFLISLLSQVLILGKDRATREGSSNEKKRHELA